MRATGCGWFGAIASVALVIVAANAWGFGLESEADAAFLSGSEAAGIPGNDTSDDAWVGNVSGSHWSEILKTGILGQSASETMLGGFVREPGGDYSFADPESDDARTGTSMEPGGSSDDEDWLQFMLCDCLDGQIDPDVLSEEWLRNEQFEFENPVLARLGT